MNPDINGTAIEIDTRDGSVQTLAPRNGLQRFEGIGFSSSGKIIGAATSDTNTVLLFRRRADGRFEDAPYWSIEGSESGLNYPHDISFSLFGAGEVLAVAQRGGAIIIYEKHRSNDTFGPTPIFQIKGPKAKLALSDAVAFVPPQNGYLAACNLREGNLLFYRRKSGRQIDFQVEPVFELKHPALFHPDGLGFSDCGKWLAVASHGNHTVSIFQRRNRFLTGGRLRYGPEPVTIIKDPVLRYPHSVAFTPETNHLVVTNAGANYFCVYAPVKDGYETRWSQTAALRRILGPDDVFREVNARNKMEGGPKGVAIHGNTLALCSPEHGIKIYSLRERSSAASN